MLCVNSQWIAGHMTAPVMWVVGEFRVLHWCRPMPACISGNKMWHPDDHLIWCPKVDSGPHNIVRMSSAHRTHKTSVPRLFQVKQQRTALLKIQKVSVTKASINVDNSIRFLICKNPFVPSPVAVKFPHLVLRVQSHLQFT